jgi:hypothetical protein
MSAESVLERSHCSVDRFVEVDQCSVYDEEDDGSGESSVITSV